MQRKHQLLMMLIGMISSLAIAFPATAAVPNLQWSAQQDVLWYQVIVEQGNYKVINEWVKDENGLCNGGTCTFDPDTRLAFGLDTGDYAATVNYWDATAKAITPLTSEPLTVSTAETSVTTPNNRVRVSVPDNPDFAWVQVWMGDAQTLKVVKHFNRSGGAAGWYKRGEDMQCNGSTCTILTQAYPTNGEYVVYLRWYNADDGVSGWSGAFDFSMNAQQTNAVSNMQATVNEQREPTFTWAGQSGATWYRIWLGSSTKTLDQWQTTIDLGCAGGGTCTFNPDVQLLGGRTYSWYVLTYGPAGNATGGLNGSGWQQGSDLVIPDGADAPDFTSNPPPSGLVDIAYTHTLSADGATPISFAVTAGALPNGLSLNGNTISGTPTTQGTFSGTITATNNAGTDTQNFEITIGASSGDAFIMKNGLTVIEAESIAPVGDWSLRTNLAGYTGNGFYVWRYGNTDEGTRPSGIDIMSYSIIIPEAGRYRFLMRGTSPAPSTEFNDIFVRVQGAGSRSFAIKPDGSSTVPLGNGWFKSYNNSVDTWKWQSSHVDNNAHHIYFEFDGAGEYVVQFSGRSHQFHMDRFVIFDADTVSVSDATNENNPESDRG